MIYKARLTVAKTILALLALSPQGVVHAESPAETNVRSLQDQLELVRGGAFESQELEDFKPEVLSGQADVTLTTSRSHSGKQALQIKGEHASVDVTQTISVEPDTVYEISFWIYTEGLVGRGMTGLLVNSEQFGLLPYVSPSLRPNDGKWHEFKVFTHSGPATKLRVSLAFGLWEDKGSGTVWYDDLSVRAIESVVPAGGRSPLAAGCDDAPGSKAALRRAI